MNLPDVSEEMTNVFSNEFQFSTYRKLWLELARAEQKFGINITNEQLLEMEAHLSPNLEIAAEVQAQLKAYKDECKTACSIIHLGATDSYLTENTRLIQIRTASAIVEKKLQAILHLLEKLTLENGNGGKFFALVLQDFLWDFWGLSNYDIPFLGIKGHNGCQEEQMALFNGDGEKVRGVDREIAASMGFLQTMTLSTQIYSRKIDLYLLSMLSNIGISAHKLSNEALRAHTKPFFKQLISFYEKGALRAAMELQDPNETDLRSAFLITDQLLALIEQALQNSQPPITKNQNSGRASAQVKELIEHLEMADIFKRLGQ